MGSHACTVPHALNTGPGYTPRQFEMIRTTNYRRFETQAEEEVPFDNPGWTSWTDLLDTADRTQPSSSAAYKQKAPTTKSGSRSNFDSQETPKSKARSIRWRHSGGRCRSE